MERLVTVEFGPSRSKRFGRALTEARSGAGECREVEPGRYRARFVLGTDSAAYAGLARLLERVRPWRATEVYEGNELVSAYHARDMTWAADELGYEPVTTYDEAVGETCAWLRKAMRGHDWRDVLLDLARYPGDLFDYAAEDAFLAGLTTSV